MKWLQLITKYFPSVLAAVVGVEAAIGSQSGAVKKQVTTNIVTAGEQIPNADVKAIGGMVDTVVTTLNDSGVFTKAPTVAT